MSARRYCFTLNNYSAQEEQHIHDVATNDTSGVQYLVAGREVGDSGTPHLQGFVIFNGRKSLLQVRALLGARCHFEVTRATSQQAADYCKKDNDFFEHGELGVGQGRRTDWDGYIEYVRDLGRVPNERELCINFPSLVARYPDACRRIAECALPKPRLVPEGCTLRDWQQDLRDVLEPECPDDRTICFFVDPEGNKGKSWFCRYMLTEFENRVQLFGVGKVTDLAYALDPEKDILLFDCARSAAEFLQYRLLEDLKNRLVQSTKYNSKMKILRKVPHVVVFMNEQPDMTKLSADRYSVTNL